LAFFSQILYKDGARFWRGAKVNFGYFNKKPQQFCNKNRRKLTLS
jgi:hypothetical protein